MFVLKPGLLVKVVCIGARFVVKRLFVLEPVLLLKAVCIGTESGLLL